MVLNEWCISTNIYIGSVLQWTQMSCWLKYFWVGKYILQFSFHKIQTKQLQKHYRLWRSCTWHWKEFVFCLLNNNLSFRFKFIKCTKHFTYNTNKYNNRQQPHILQIMLYEQGTRSSCYTGRPPATYPPSTVKCP